MYYPQPPDDPKSKESPPPDYDPNLSAWGYEASQTPPAQGSPPYNPPPGYPGYNVPPYSPPQYQPGQPPYNYKQPPNYPGYTQPPYNQPGQPPFYGAPPPSQQSPYGPPPNYSPPSYGPGYGGQAYGSGQQQVYAPLPQGQQQNYNYGAPAYGYYPQAAYYPAMAMPKASFGRRLAARLIDTVILSVAMVGLIAIAAFFAGLGSGFLSFLSVLAIIILGVGYEVYYIGKHGATPGKKWLKIKVVNRNGQVPGYGPSWGRYLMQIFASAQIFYLGYLWMLWDPQGQTWHDRVAGTYVVQERI